MQRLIANLLMCWTLLLVPGAAALELGQPEMLLPACCRVHGAHHCMMASIAFSHGANTPAWTGPGCPFAYLLHAAVVLTPYLPTAGPHFASSAQVARIAATKQSSLATYLAGLPASRAPPVLS